MTPDEFRLALRELGWSRSELSERAGTHLHTIDRWAKDGPPGPIVAFLNLALEVKRRGGSLVELVEPKRRK